VKFKYEINGIIDERLEGVSDITDIYNLIYAAKTIMTQTMNNTGKRIKN
jgi:hypothetical protein